MQKRCAGIFLLHCVYFVCVCACVEKMVRLLWMHVYTSLINLENFGSTITEYQIECSQFDIYFIFGAKYFID